MTRIDPKWVETFEGSLIKRDLSIAVRCCTIPFCHSIVEKWLDSYDSGKYQSLQDREHLESVPYDETELHVNHDVFVVKSAGWSDMA